MKNIYKHQQTFIIAFAIWFIIAASLLLIRDKIFWQITVNENHTLVFDYFFKYFTLFGDGILIVIFAVLMLFVRYRLAIFTLLSYLLSGLFAQLLKRYVFEDNFRPSSVFSKIDYDLLQVLDVSMESRHSFPSGHTTSAFAFFCTLSLFFAAKNGIIQMLLFLSAFLVGFSRIYLNQHFLSDVFMGSILGVLTTLFLYLWVSRWKAKWLDRSVLTVSKKN
jgi:membrane-associated phospholipid phosphatase